MKYEPENLYYKYLGYNFALYIYTCGRHSHLLRPGRWGGVINVKVNYSVSAQSGHEAHTATCTMATESFSGFGIKFSESSAENTPFQLRSYEWFGTLFRLPLLVPA
jgi:hypothetical protein